MQDVPEEMAAIAVRYDNSHQPRSLVFGLELQRRREDGALETMCEWASYAMEVKGTEGLGWYCFIPEFPGQWSDGELRLLDLLTFAEESVTPYRVILRKRPS